MISTDIDIEKLRKIVELFKAYDEIRNRTPLEGILVQEEKKFSEVYPEINLERSNEINPLTACATGTTAAVVLSEIMFSGGQLSPLSRVRQDKVLDVIDCVVANKNFVSTVHFKNAQVFHNEHHTTEQRSKDDEIKLLLNFAQNSQSCLIRKIFLDKVKKSCIDNENIYHDMSGALDNDVLKYFEKLSKIPALIFGDGIGQYEGNDWSTFYRVQVTLFEKFNIRFIAVEKEYIELVEPLKKINPDLNIAIIDQEELLKFTKKYNNTECDNATRESFMEALVKHFNLSLTLQVLPFLKKINQLLLQKSQYIMKAVLKKIKIVYVIVLSRLAIVLKV
ncbi:hypothetical protein [Wolbachia endosymbiont (group E) of Neria commutata]|uniref:hypothetical protein n=1 Tax=Wolbachia endosymbiont (group E) of Neria commutata TaxID=3066149 RepID=UPI003132F805